MAGRARGGSAQSDTKTVINIPAVMISKSDADRLLKSIKWMENIGIVPQYEIVVESTPMALDNAYMGFASYPKIHVQDNTIAVHSMRDWGVVFSAAVGGQWHMMMKKNEDLTVLTPWKVRALTPAQHGQDGGSTLDNEISTASHYFTTNPVDIYRRILSRKCPSHVSVSRDGEGASQVLFNKELFNRNSYFASGKYESKMLGIDDSSVFTTRGNIQHLE